MGAPLLLVSRDQLSHNRVADYMCPCTCAFVLTSTLPPLTAGKVPPSTHSPRSDAMLSTPLCKLLREAGADKRVRAVVLRVDSPGADRVHPAWQPTNSASHCRQPAGDWEAHCRRACLPGLHLLRCNLVQSVLAALL